jgi:hypothetical protein
MSQENVELIVGLHVEPSDDWAWIVRDDATWSALSSTVSDLFHPDFESTIPLFGSAKTYTPGRLPWPVGRLADHSVGSREPRKPPYDACPGPPATQSERVAGPYERQPD